MWKVVEKPFIWFCLAKTYVNMKFKTGETDFGYVQHTGFLTRPIRCAMHFSANGLGFGLAMDLPGDTLWIAAEVGSVDHKSLRQGLWSRLSRESPKTCICIASVALGLGLYEGPQGPKTMPCRSMSMEAACRPCAVMRRPTHWSIPSMAGPVLGRS